MDDAHENPTRIRRDLGLFLALALACRVAFMLAMRRVIDSPDAIHYLELAAEYASGDLLAVGPRIPLLYSALTALVHVIVPDPEWAARLVSVVVSALLVMPVYVLAHAMHGRRAARCAALLMCLWPWLTDYGSRVAPDALTATLWFTAVWCLVRSLRSGGLYVVLAPLAFFALHLSRPEGGC